MGWESKAVDLTRRDIHITRRGDKSRSRSRVFLFRSIHIHIKHMAYGIGHMGITRAKKSIMWGNLIYLVSLYFHLHLRLRQTAPDRHRHRTIRFGSIPFARRTGDGGESAGVKAGRWLVGWGSGLFVCGDVDLRNT